MWGFLGGLTTTLGGIANTAIPAAASVYTAQQNAQAQAAANAAAIQSQSLANTQQMQTVLTFAVLGIVAFVIIKQVSTK